MVVIKGKRVHCKSTTHSDTGNRNLALGVRDSHVQKKGYWDTSEGRVMGVNGSLRRRVKQRKGTRTEP